MPDLREDPDERRMFTDSCNALYDGSPLQAIAGALTTWHQMAPSQGSYGKMLAIYANECANGAKEIARLTSIIEKKDAALVQARGALRLDHMVDEEGQPYGTTTVALDEISAALDLH